MPCIIISEMEAVVVINIWRNSRRRDAVRRGLCVSEWLERWVRRWKRSLEGEDRLSGPMGRGTSLTRG